MRFGSRPVRSIIAKPTAPAGPSPYDPGSRGYADRHREHRHKVSPSMTRVDVGAPVPVTVPAPEAC